MNRFLRPLISLSSLTVFITVTVWAPLPVQASTSLPISARSALLMDASSHALIYSKNIRTKRPPASTTKVLTALVVADMMELDEVVRIPAFAEHVQPSKVYLRAGERYYVRDLLRALLMKSANDAAEVLAVAAAGSKSAFAARMNSKCRAIGCRNSNFVNPHGLPNDRQVSTAYDLALIMGEVEKYPFLQNVLRTRTTDIHSLDGRRISLRSHNRMLWRENREVIGKTGWTRSARHCFVGHIGSGSRRTYVSMLGSNGLWNDLRILVDYSYGKSIKAPRTGLKLRGRREDTLKVQRALKKAGYYKGRVDGIFGPVTDSALKRFQRQKGLKPDGIVGPNTMAKLKAYF